MIIKINGLKWLVKNGNGNSAELTLNDAPCLGITKYVKCEIVIRSDLSKELYRSTVVHELVHAYAFSYGVHLIANEETEESICDFIGAYLDAIHKHTETIMKNLYGKG